MISEGTPPPSPLTQQSPWHSPVPYLFGGLAAMLGLIAFALLILACSYWKLSGYLDGDNGDGGDGGDLESGKGDGVSKQQPYEYEDKFPVYMPGDVKPSFLATLVPSRNSSFGCPSSFRKCEKLDEDEAENETVTRTDNSSLSGGGGQVSNSGS